MMLAKMQLIGYVGSERYLDRAGRVEWRFNSMIGKITKVSVERLGANQMLWDSGLVGFGARRQRRHVHYLLRYRLNGTQRFHSIGRHGAWTPDTARNEARRLLGLVASKIDPANERVTPGETFGAELDRYIERKRSSLRPRSLVEVERYLRVQCKSLHHLPLAGIDRRTIALTLAEIEQRSGPVARNRARTSLSAMFAYAIREGLIDGANPVQGTGKASEGNGRERVLTQDELASILRALGSDPFSEIIRLLVLTGQRRSEIGGLRWSEVDLERGFIVLPPDRVKNGRQHEVPLSTQARAILERQPRRNEFVFGVEWNSWSETKAKLDARLEGQSAADRVAAWTLHDLRRSAATHMAELGTQPHIVEAILNHYSGHRAGVAGIYNRARYADEMRSALQRWADRVDGGLL
jgi:integrase